jgi:two-component system cell cycle sensor histidine kinase/response regulator CckA
MIAEIPEKQIGSTVLVVDDDPFIQELAVMMIETFGFATLVAADGGEGVKLVDKHREEILLVLCDLNMPGMDGWQTLSAIRAIAPELPVVITSGHAIDEAMCREYPDQPWGIMNKPYAYDDFVKLFHLLPGKSIPIT